MIQDQTLRRVLRWAVRLYVTALVLIGIWIVAVVMIGGHRGQP